MERHSQDKFSRGDLPAEKPAAEKPKSKIGISQQVDENYLKTILILRDRCGCAFVRDVAEELGVKAGTVHSAIPKLTRAGYITSSTQVNGRYARQTMELTPKGEALAEKILNRHQTIKGWLVRLGIPEEEADAEACQMEHGITDATMDVIQRHVDSATRFMKGKKLPMADDAPPAAEQGNGGLDRRQEQEYRRFQELIQEAGGTEGVRKKIELSARAGGDAKLETLLEIMEQANGTSALRAAVEEYERLREIAAHWGGVKRTFDALEKLENLGGRETLNLLAELSETRGDALTTLKLLKRTFALWDAD